MFFEPKLLLKIVHRKHTVIWRSCSVIISVVFDIGLLSLNSAYSLPTMCRYTSVIIESCSELSIFFESLQVEGKSLLCAGEWSAMFIFSLFPLHLILLNRTTGVGWFKGGRELLPDSLSDAKKKKSELWPFLLLLLLRGWSYTNRHPELVWFNFV